MWIDRTYFECGGTSYDFGVTSATDPAHYLVILKSATVDKTLHQKLTFTITLNRMAGLSHPIVFRELEDDEVLVEIISPKIKSLKAGVTIELQGYSLSGDERSVVAEHRTLKIDDKEILRQIPSPSDDDKPIN